MMTVFIACSKLKKSYRAPAKKLYQGLLFKKALEYSLQNYENIYILSAKYGIVPLDTIIEPYDKTLNKMNKIERNEWYDLVKKQMIELNLKKPFIFFTGILYNKPFEGEKPLYKLSLGLQLRWFNEHLKKIKLDLR